MFFFSVSGLVGVSSLFGENLACHVRHCASQMPRRLEMNWAHSSSKFKLSLASSSATLCKHLCRVDLGCIVDRKGTPPPR
jgi:hypothetical protein